MKNRSFPLLMALLLVLSAFSSCAENREKDEPSETAPTASTPAETEPEETQPEEETVPAPELPADLDFGGASFTFGVVDNPNMKSGMIVEELTGAVLEEANYRAKLHLTPSYYDITLKGKYSRDPESIAMLDLIFANRVVDLGDSLFCVNVRDGFVYSMFSGNNRDLVSTVKKNEKVVTKTAQKMIDELRSGN